MEKKIDIDALKQAKGNPEAAKLIEKLSPEDRKRLEETLSSPDSIKKLLSTPQARQLLERMKGNGK